MPQEWQPEGWSRCCTTLCQSKLCSLLASKAMNSAEVKIDHQPFSLRESATLESIFSTLSISLSSSVKKGVVFAVGLPAEQTCLKGWHSIHPCSAASSKTCPVGSLAMDCGQPTPHEQSTESTVGMSSFFRTSASGRLWCAPASSTECAPWRIRRNHFICLGSKMHMFPLSVVRACQLSNNWS